MANYLHLVKDRHDMQDAKNTYDICSPAGLVNTAKYGNYSTQLNVLKFFPGGERSFRIGLVKPVF